MFFATGNCSNVFVPERFSAVFEGRFRFESNGWKETSVTSAWPFEGVSVVMLFMMCFPKNMIGNQGLHRTYEYAMRWLGQDFLRYSLDSLPVQDLNMWTH